MDVFAEAEGLKRRRALLESLQQQSMQPNIQGGRGLALAQMIAAIAGQRQASKGLQQVTELEGANRARYGSEMGQELERYMAMQQGSPGQFDPNEMGDASPNAAQIATPADPRRAVMQAIASRFPELQQVGQAGLKEMLQRKPVAKPDDWKIAPDGTPYRTRPDGSFEIHPGNFGKPEKPLVQIDNFPHAREKDQERRLKDVAPSGDYFKDAKADNANLGATTEALAALREGAKTGILEPFMQGFRKVVAYAGVENAATAPTDTLASLLAARTMAAIGGKLGGQVSNTDLEFVKSMTGARTTDPQALKRLMAIAAAASMKNLNRFNQEVDDLAQGEGTSYVGRYRQTLNFMPDDAEFDQMVQNVLAGKPTVMGTSAPRSTVARPAADGSIDFRSLRRGR